MATMIAHAIPMIQKSWLEIANASTRASQKMIENIQMAVASRTTTFEARANGINLPFLFPAPNEIVIRPRIIRVASVKPRTIHPGCATVLSAEAIRSNEEDRVANHIPKLGIVWFEKLRVYRYGKYAGPQTMFQMRRVCQLLHRSLSREQALA